jgi:hypothetical protein
MGEQTPDHERSPNGSAPPPADSLSAGARGLRDVALRIEDFLMEQVERLEDAIETTLKHGQFTDPPPPATDDLEDERRRWEVEKQREWKRIQGDAAQLAQAWQRVEIEQRRLLAERNASRVVSATDREPLGAENDTWSTRTTDHAQPPWSDQATCQPGADQPLMTQESAILQFQQLRREMQKHSQREL